MARCQGHSDPKNGLRIRPQANISLEHCSQGKTHLWPWGPWEPWWTGLPSASSNGVASIAFLSLGVESRVTVTGSTQLWREVADPCLSPLTVQRSGGS